MNNVSPKKHTKIMYFFTIFLSTINFVIILFQPHTSNNLTLISILLLISSILIVVRTRNSKSLFFLFSILAYINISIAVLDGFLGGDLSGNYQLTLRLSQYNDIYMKSLLINITIISLLITPKIIRSAQSENMRIDISRKDNIIILLGGSFLLILFIVFGYESSSGATFRGTARTIYEYAILLFIIIYYYGKNHKYFDYLLMLFAIIYILQGLYYGDRSSALVMMFLLLMFFSKTFNLKKMFIYMLSGVLFANMVAIYRNLSNFSISTIFSGSFNSGFYSLFSDTASASYYTGVAITASRELVDKTPYYYFFRFLNGLFFGSSSAFSYDSNITTVASNFYNFGGGGIYPSYFYFFGGFVGVIIGSLLLGMVIRRVYSINKPIYSLLQYYMTVMAFRWYLYTPFTFFRTTLLIFFVVYAVTYIFDLTMNKTSKNFVYRERIKDGLI
jgi:hypothetical protein